MVRAAVVGLGLGLGFRAKKRAMVQREGEKRGGESEARIVYK
jgi:hypothetical protein